MIASGKEEPWLAALAGRRLQVGLAGTPGPGGPLTGRPGGWVVTIIMMLTGTRCPGQTPAAPGRAAGSPRVAVSPVGGGFERGPGPGRGGPPAA